MIGRKLSSGPFFANLVAIGEDNVGVVGLVLLAVITVSCASPTRKEIARVPSPDHMVDAVLVEVEPDALAETVPVSSFVYIVPTGSSQLDDPVFNGDHFEGLKLAWKRPKFLEIEFKKGRVYHFTNFWVE